MMKQALNQILDKQDMTELNIMKIAKELLLQQCPELIAAFLVSLRSKGETIDEITGFVRFLQHEMVRVNVPFPVMDIVGTGGDHSNTINISTASAIVAASAGVKIAKHGNRSVSSLCGSADVITELGIPLLSQPEQIQKCIEKAGIGFMFAPNFHPAMKVFAPVRQALKIRTIFNMIGPLLNPANAQSLMIGVYSQDLLFKLADVLQRIGHKNAFIFHGQGLDELSCLGPAEYIHVTGQGQSYGTLDPKNYGLAPCKLEDLKGGNAKENARTLIEIFQGKQGSISNSIALNAGVAQFLYGTATSIEEGIEHSKHLIKLEKPYETLMQWREVCQQF